MKRLVTVIALTGGLLVATPSASLAPPLPHAVKLCTNYSPGSSPNVEVCRFINIHAVLYEDIQAIGRIERAVDQVGDGMTIYHVKLQSDDGGGWVTRKSWIGPAAEYDKLMERATDWDGVFSHCYWRAEVKFRVTWPGADTGVLTRYSGIKDGGDC